MPVRKLSQRDFDRPPPVEDGKSKTQYCDKVVPGLILEVRATNPYSATIYLRYKDANGKTCYIKLGTTQTLNLKQARIKVRKLKAEIANGRNPQLEAKQRKAVLTWDQLIDDYYIKHAVQVKRSWKNDLDMHNLRLKAAIGTTPINKISVQQVQSFLNELKATGLKGSTVDHYLKFIRHALNLAVDWELIDSHPIGKIRQLNEDSQVERYLSQKELQRFFATLKSYPNRPYALLITWLLATGARSGEGRTAQWSDIDEASRVWVVQAVNSKSKRRRSIPLNDVALEVLSELKAMGNTSGHLFVGKKGPYKELGCNWKHLCQAAGIEGLRIHDLRHNFASLLVNAGHSLYEVQQVLGHSDPKVTMRYAHLSQGRMQQAANSVANAIKAATS